MNDGEVMVTDQDHCWVIPADQIVRIQNRISDVRECGIQVEDDVVSFIAATYELLGTLDTVLFDTRNCFPIKRHERSCGETVPCRCHEEVNETVHSTESSEDF